MSEEHSAARTPPRVIVAGSGVGAVETVLALRALAEPVEIEIDLVAREDHFVYRPLAVVEPFGYPPQAYLWFALLALVPQLLGHSTFNWALRYLTVAFVSISLLGEPIGSTILAYFLLDEIPSALKIFGAILILVGIYIASRGEEKT